MSVAVASSVLGTSLVGREAGHATVLVHLDEVEGTVETARQVGHVNVEGELLVLELEHLVLGLGFHKVNTGADVGASYEFEGELVAGGRNTVGAGVVSAIERAIGRACCRVRAELSVPLVAIVAVGVATDVVDPAPVRVKHYGARLRAAATACRTLLDRERRVVLRRGGTRLLAANDRSKDESEQSSCTEHC